MQATETGQGGTTGIARGLVRRRGSGAENFPVAFRLIAPRLRAPILAFYRYARAADDVADDPRLSPAAKLARLDGFEAGLGRSRVDAPAAAEAVALREAVDGDPATLDPARALLGAFRQDARGATYRSWEDLRAYCTMSADPVGRFLLRLHGEDAKADAPADALSTALQILNHLQDLREDRDHLGRVYLPADWLAAEGASPADLSRDRLTPEARRAVDRGLDACDALLVEAAPLPGRIRARGLRGQAAATLHLGRGLSARLRARDPLATRVTAGRAAFARAGLVGTWHAARSPR